MTKLFPITKQLLEYCRRYFAMARLLLERPCRWAPCAVARLTRGFEMTTPAATCNVLLSIVTCCPNLPGRNDYHWSRRGSSTTLTTWCGVRTVDCTEVLLLRFGVTRSETFPLLEWRHRVSQRAFPLTRRMHPDQTLLRCWHPYSSLGTAPKLQSRST